MNRIARICDVTLRDGIQALNKGHIFTPYFKNFVIKNLIKSNITDIEIGANVTPKLVQMANTQEIINRIEYNPSNNYMVLVPNYEKHIETLKWDPLKNIKTHSLITACSRTFIEKNTRMSFEDNINELDKIIFKKYDNPVNYRLYISCCFGCPFEGYNFEHDLLLYYIIYRYNNNVSEIVISDTIGTYEQERLDWIVDHFRYTNKLSLHLHSNWNEEQVFNFVKKYVNKFVSLDTSLGALGGCPAIDGKEVKPNLNTVILAKSINKLLNKPYYNIEMLEILNRLFISGNTI